MMLIYAWRLVTRSPRRTATYLFGLALAVGLFAGILFFVDATARQMTATAIAPVKLDIVAHATKPDVNVVGMLPTITAQRGIRAAEAVFAADFASAQKVGAAQASASGRMFAISPSYFQTFDILQISEGQFDPSGVLVSEAMAIAQNLKVGDQLQLTFSGVDSPVVLPITGIINLDNAEALFATTTEAENALVSDVALVDSTWFQLHLSASLAAATATIGGLSLVIGVVVGVGLAFMLVMLLGVIFTIPAHGLSIPVLELFSLVVLVVAGMVISALVSARRLARLKVVEALREL